MAVSEVAVQAPTVQAEVAVIQVVEQISQLETLVLKKVVVVVGHTTLAQIRSTLKQVIMQRAL
jgi:hypothetical protein